MFNLNFKDCKISKYTTTGFFSEDLAAVKNYEGLWGYINKEGKEAIQCQYKEVKKFSAGLAAVKNYEGLWGYINKEGKEVIPCQYKEVGIFTEPLDLAPVKIDSNTWIYIDKTGKQAKNHTFAEAEPFYEGYAIVKTFYSSGYYYMDNKGELHGPYDTACNFKNGIAMVADQEYLYTINESFEIINKISQNKYKKISTYFYDFLTFKDLHDNIGYLDKNFNEKIPNIYQEGTNFFDGVAIVELSNDFIGFVTPEGKITAFSKKHQYEKINEFSEGLALVKNTQGLYGYINKNGKEVIPCQYKDADDFSEGLAGVVDTEGVFHYIDKKGKKKITIETLYNSILELDDKTIYISEKNQEQLDEKKLFILNLVKKEVLEQVENSIDNLAFDSTSGLYKQPKTRKKKFPKSSRKIFARNC